MRARDLGLTIGRLPSGAHDAITDVAGVRVGHATLIRGDGPLVVGEGPVRTGVTVVLPHDGDVWTEPVFAGCHRLNGNGELTGLEWIREAGQLGGAVAITNTHSVGVARDALVAHAVRRRRHGGGLWSLPVVGETWDGLLNDIDGLHVRPEHVDEALSSAAGGPVAEGNVGGGTGMICHEFKGGIGTASRVVPDADGGWTVGVLVQANYGEREQLRVDGVPVGEAIPTSEVTSPYDDAEAVAARASAGSGSIIIVVATDAPLLPHQCERAGATRGPRSGAHGRRRRTTRRAISSSPSPRAIAACRSAVSDGGPATLDVRMVPEQRMTPLFKATARRPRPPSSTRCSRLRR